MPRAAFGYLALGTIGMLVGAGLMAPVDAELEDAVQTLARVVEECGPAMPASINQAKTLALAVGDRVPVIWGAEGIGAVAAARWKTELNENAKVPAFWSELPELDHNEVVGWSSGRGREFLVVALRHDGEHPDVAARFPPSIDVARSAGAGVAEVWARGASDLSRLLELVLRGDMASTYLAIARGVDPTPIEAIARLKQALTETSASGSIRDARYEPFPAEKV
jgi:glucose/mannose-6-phosphate isomerase